MSSTVRFDDSLNSSVEYHRDASPLGVSPQRRSQQPQQLHLHHHNKQQQQQQQYHVANTSLSSSGGAPEPHSKHEVILAVHLHPQTRTTGAAAYNAETAELAICPDFQESNSYEFLAQLIAGKSLFHC